MADHEGHLGGSYGTCGDDEVAFIFAGRGVEDDEEGAGSEGFYAGFYGVELGWVVSVICAICDVCKWLLLLQLRLALRDEGGGFC